MNPVPVEHRAIAAEIAENVAALRPAFKLEMPGQEYIDAWTACEGLPAHWSPAQVNLARSCKEKYRFRYVLGIKTPPARALLWGGASAAAQEFNFAQKITTREDLPIDEVQDAFRDAVDFKIDEAGGSSEIDWGEAGAERGKAEMVDDGARLIGVYQKVLAPKVQPLAVEEATETTLPGITVPVSMRVDVRDELGILDSKTTGQGRLTPENQVQGRIYSAATGLPTRFHLLVKPRKPGGTVNVLEAPEVIEASNGTMATTLTAVRRTLAEIVWCYQTFGPDEPWPDALSHPWSCGYCGFRDAGLCSYWK